MRILPAILLLAPTTLPAQDTLVVRADNPPVWGDSPRLVEELRIGSLAGDEHNTFGYVSGLATTASGDVWVTDNGLKTIRRYSSDGVHLGDVSREGQGPGELSYPMDLRRLTDGSMALWDPLNQRIHLFGDDGGFLEDIRVPVRGVTRGRDIQTLVVDTAGRLYGRGFRPRTPTTPGESYWLRVSTDRATIDTIAIRPSNREGYYQEIRTWSALSPHGYQIWGRNDASAFHRPLSDGRIVRIERSLEPVRYQDREADEAQTLEDHYAGRWGEAPRRMPDTKPLWSSFSIDADGRLWIARYVEGMEVAETEAQREARLEYDNPERTWGQPLVYDVLDPRGLYLGTLEVPNSTSAVNYSRPELMLARDTEVWTLERGEYDEHYVVRYRIEPDEGDAGHEATVTGETVDGSEKSP